MNAIGPQEPREPESDALATILDANLEDLEQIAEKDYPISPVIRRLLRKEGGA